MKYFSLFFNFYYILTIVLFETLKNSVDEQLGGISLLISKPNQSCYSWISQRITGYLVFLNTQRTQPNQQLPPQINKNKIYGERWKSMSQSEKAKYEDVAQKAKVYYLSKFQNFEYHKDNEPPIIKEIDKEISNLTLDSCPIKL